jgi:Uma2 family endonuclease
MVVPMKFPSEVPIMPVATPVTPDQFRSMPDAKHVELVDGQVVERRSSMLSSYVTGELFAELRRFVASERRGWMFGPGCGYRCFPMDRNRIRRPSISFVAGDRLRADEITDDWCTVAPDLVVEVVGPDETADAVLGRLLDYWEAGVFRVWVVIPRNHSATIYRPDRTGMRLRRPVELAGEGPLEGFRCALDDLYPTFTAPLRAGDAADGNGQS